MAWLISTLLLTTLL
ncbi:UNVERIFIED_CONTAM: hypothetical protein GTU68_000545 [Idotea baltica]|nr:hypothetical protein [Idotea baltica]